MPFELGASAPKKIAVIGAGISGMGAAYMLADGNVLSGVPAFAIKEAIEQQFALFAKGFDTYSIVEGIPGLG